MLTLPFLFHVQEKRASFLGRKSVTKKAQRGSTTASSGAASAARRPPTSASATANLPYEASFYYMNLDHLKGPILQSQMNPSEPFIADDYLSPYDIESYEYPARKDLPNLDKFQKDQKAKQQSQRSQNRRPRLAVFNIFRKNSVGGEGPVLRWDEDLNRRHAIAAAHAHANTTLPGSLEHQTSLSTALTSIGGGGSGETQDSSSPEADATMTTPLHEAARLGSGDFIRFLLANGGDPNIKNGMSRTALHMASGGLTVEEERLSQAMKRPTEKKKVKTKKKKVQPAPAPVGISSPTIQPEVFGLMKEELQKTKDPKGKTQAQKAAMAVGWIVRSALGSPSKEKAVPSEPPSSGKTKKVKFDPVRWNHVMTERMDSVLAVLAWFHAETGEGPSINAVDADGRTALHYAAELGRSDVCMAILSNFGAMLTIIDELGARTPCELAGANGHKELAAQLEARALLYIDPYGVDDELMANMLQIENNRGGGRHDSDDPRRRALVPPFSWFETMTLDRIGAERIQRLEAARAKMLKIVLSYDENATELDRVMESAAKVGLQAALRGDDSDDDESTSTNEETSISINNASDKDDPTSATKAANMSMTEIMAAAEKAGLDAALKVKVSNNSCSNINSDDTAETKMPSAKAKSDCSEQSTLQMAFSYLQESDVERFLAHHKWNVSEAVKAFKGNPRAAFLKAGIDLPSPPPSSTKTASEGRTCLICYDDAVDKDQWVELAGCVHGFCTDCLKDYLKDRASTKSAYSSIACPHHNCETILTRGEIDSILGDEPNSAARINEATQEQFVTSAHDFKFCNHPGCPGIVHRLPQTFLTKHGIDDALINYAGAVCTADSSRGMATCDPDCPLTYEGMESPNYHDCRSKDQPRKAHRFCFGCGEARHWPIPCQRLEEWRQKVREEIGAVEADGESKGGNNVSELAQKLWIKTNTRPCPKVRCGTRYKYCFYSFDSDHVALIGCYFCS